MSEAERLFNHSMSQTERVIATLKETQDLANRAIAAAEFFKNKCNELEKENSILKKRLEKKGEG